MDSSIKVSVVLPVYNAEQFLAEAIKSVIEQTYCNFELIIINDGSKDKSKEIIHSYHDTRIRYIENETNLGLIKTLNKGIGLCTGEYIFRMDADDICEPHRVESQIRFMEKHPEIGLCGSWARVINSTGEITGKIINQTSPKFISVSLLFSVPIVHPSVCFRASILKNPVYHEVPVAEDYDLWCRLNDGVKLANIPELLFRYRWHDSNISKEKQDIQKKNKLLLISKELSKLGIETNDDLMQTHRLSFSLYSFGKMTNNRIDTDSLIESGKWFNNILSANKLHKRYNQDALRAFLWGRWIVLCKAAKQKYKIFFPPFASLSPRVICLLAQQILLLSKK